MHSEVWFWLVLGSLPPFSPGCSVVGPLGFGISVFSVEGEVFNLSGKVVVGISFLFGPFFHFALFPFPLFLGLWGGLFGGVGSHLLGRGWGLPLCLVMFPILVLV